MAIEVVEKITDRDYPYVLVHCVRIAPPIAVGIRDVLGYCEKTVEEALEFVARIHPEMEVFRVVNYIEV
jgi:hypothetical protein